MVPHSGMKRKFSWTKIEFVNFLYPNNIQSQLYSGDLSLDRDLNLDLGKHDCCTVTN